ncbi:MAG: hypothetical protein ACRDE2_12620 [Chitinophagaceae bacterium]
MAKRSIKGLHMTKVVINGCFGGFGLSPEALLELHKREVTEIANPVDEYYPVAQREESEKKNLILSYKHAITEWRKYLNDTEHNRSIFLTVFSPDEQFILYGDEISRTNPELIKLIEEKGSE